MRMPTDVGSRITRAIMLQRDMDGAKEEQLSGL
jgi:hypothetical protein